MVADGGRRGYRHLLEAFWDDAKSQAVQLPQETPVSAAAFCNARRKLKSGALRALLQDAVTAFDQQHGAEHRFHGRRLLAVDGSKIPVQRSAELWRAFGSAPDAVTPQALVTTLFDVIAKIPIDCTVAPFASDEREQLGHLLDRLRPLDIVLLDQGYPSYEIISLISEREVDFVVRVPTLQGFSVVEEFARSGKPEADVVLVPTKWSEAHGQGPFILRAIRRDGGDGKPQVFLTSLPRSSFPRSAVIELYQLRWEVEGFFRLEKGPYLGHDQFHARTSDGVRQEVFTLLLFVVLSRTLIAAAAKLRGVPYSRISQKGALLAAADRFVVLLLQHDARRARSTLLALLHRIARCLDQEKRRRAYPRRSFKPRSRWGPKGNIHQHAPSRNIR
jgi:hypothetical protein